MPSYSNIWIPGVVVANVVGFALLIYAYEHLHGLVSRYVNLKGLKPRYSVNIDEDDDDEGPEFKKRKKKSKPADRDLRQVAIDVDDFALYPVVLTWENVKYTVATGDAKAFKVVVQPCSGSFLPSEFVALMGPSGAGKSSMLDLLAGRKIGKGMEGSVTLNSHQITPKIANRYISYVGQEDVFMPTLSVWETLLFVSQLAMQPTTKAKRAERMSTVLETLGLLRNKDSKVGGELPGGMWVRGLSGGEQRRLSIACGLVANPSIVFLDEPTTGLDSHAAMAVMKYMHSLTHIGHTIISTIHQPRQEIFASFDKLVVMSEGYLLFLAPPSYIVPWFADVLNLPYDKARDGTVADWLLGAVAVGFQKEGEAQSRSMSSLEEVKLASEKFTEFVATSQKTVGSSAVSESASIMESSQTDFFDPPESTAPSESNFSSRFGFGTKGSAGSRWLMGQSVTSGIGYSDGSPGVVSNPMSDERTVYVRSWHVQCAVLWKRFMFQQLRNPVEAAMRLLTSSWYGIFFGLVWIRLPNTIDSFQERLSLLFYMTMILCMVPFCYMAFPQSDKRFFRIDITKGLYCPSAYFISYLLAFVPFIIIDTFATGIVMYGLVGLRYEATAILQLNAIFALQASIATEFVTAMVWYFSGQDTGFSLATIYVSFSLLICGFYIRISDITLSFIRGLTWISWSKYSFQALAHIELENRVWEPVSCTANLPQVNDGFNHSVSICYFQNNTNPLLNDIYDFKLSIGVCAGALMGFWVLMSALGYYALLKVYKTR